MANDSKINGLTSTPVFDGTARRSEKLPALDDIPYEALEEIAIRYSIGEDKYGRDNWKTGGPEFFRQAYSHALRHLTLAANRNETEEDTISNIAAAAWGCVILLWWEKTGKQKWLERDSNTPRSEV